MSIKKKITSIVVFCIILISIVSVLCFYLLSEIHKQTLYNSTANSFMHTSKEIASQLDNINTMADMILADQVMQNNLSTLKDTNNVQLRSNSYRTVYETQHEYYFAFKKYNVDFITIYQDGITISTSVEPNATLPEFVLMDLDSIAKEAKGKTVWTLKYSNDPGIYMVKDLRRTKYLGLDSLGTLMVKINTDDLMYGATNINSNFKNTSYILYDENNIAFNSSNVDYTNTLDIEKTFKSEYDFITTEDTDYFYVKGVIPQFGWNYISLIENDNLIKTLNVSIRLCLFIIIFSIIFAIILSSKLIDNITVHFDNLLMKMEYFAHNHAKVPKSEYNYDIRLDEVGILHTRFDQMVVEVDDLIKTNYLNELLIKDAQLKILESQINPHFLYNTLESINWRAKIIGAKDISKMSESLGTLLRIALDQQHKTVPLKQELDLIKSYMTIQKYRYEDKLEYIIFVPPELLDYEVLKLSLQPLVENAIRYGLEQNTEECIISIIGEIIEGKLIIYIKNTLSTFEDNLLEKLETKEIKPHGFGIGLTNINDRMRLTYGEECNLKIYNEEDVAVVKLTFPLKQFTK